MKSRTKRKFLFINGRADHSFRAGTTKLFMNVISTVVELSNVIVIFSEIQH